MNHAYHNNCIKVKNKLKVSGKFTIQTHQFEVLFTTNLMKYLNCYNYLFLAQTTYINIDLSIHSTMFYFLRRSYKILMF